MAASILLFSVTFYERTSMRNSGIGGQAVLEGIMMKNKDKYAVAVRKPDHDIEICVKEYKSLTSKNKFFSAPFIRGVFNFADSLVLGMSTLMYSASFYDDEEPEDTKKSQKKSAKNTDESFKQKQESVIMTITVIISVIISLALFIVAPSLISDFIKMQFGIKMRFVNSLIESFLRLAIFLAYIVLISKMEDIQRTFMYHGAEHKCINCVESGKELTVENVLESSRLHRRCGTSFLFLVMFISILFFILIPVEQPLLKIVVRLLLIPVIAGVSYEVLRYAGSHDGVCVRMVSAPGLALQKLTTKEPDAEMAEVAIKAVEAVFDWKEYLRSLE